MACVLSVLCNLCTYRFLSCTLFFLLEELSLILLDELAMNSVIIYVSEKDFISPSLKKKRYFHWIWNPGLTLFLFFGTLKILFLFLLACMVSKEKSAIVFLSLHLSCLFSSDFLQEFVFCFSSLNMILIQVCAGSLFLFLEGIELSFFLLVFL